MRLGGKSRDIGLGSIRPSPTPSRREEGGELRADKWTRDVSETKREEGAGWLGHGEGKEIGPRQGGGRMGRGSNGGGGKEAGLAGFQGFPPFFSFFFPILFPRSF